VAKNYNASLTRNPFAKTSATVIPTPGPTPAPALPKPGVETPPTPTPTPVPTTPGNAKTQRDDRLARAAKWKGRQPSVQSTSVGEEDNYHDALANREADREAEEKNLKKLPRSAFESLSWSKNFNPGMTLFRQMKREQS
jgi:hypothetical protein